MIPCALRLGVLLFLLNVQIVPGVNEKVTRVFKDNKCIGNQSENNEKNESIDRTSVNNEQIKNLKNSWYLNIPILPIVVATSNSIPNGPCKKQLDLYLSHLNNGTLWATESKLISC